MREIVLDEIDSTNSYAKNNIGELADKTVIHAMRQSSGRGRLNRIWLDLGLGNLFLSFVLKPSGTYKKVYANLTQYLCVCLSKVLEKYGVTSQIKWPNDVLVNDKKIAGILSEAIVSKSSLKGIVLGIGVNLNASKADLDKVKERHATSLNLEVNKSIDLNVFKKELLEEFFLDYDKFISQGFSLIESYYLSHNCFLHKNLQVQMFDKIETGYADRVNSDGELVLVKDKKELVITIGDIL